MAWCRHTDDDDTLFTLMCRCPGMRELILLVPKLLPESMLTQSYPDSKIHGANMGPIWGRQDPGGPHVGPMTFAIWVYCHMESVGHSELSPRRYWTGHL